MNSCKINITKLCFVFGFAACSTPEPPPLIEIKPQVDVEEVLKPKKSADYWAKFDAVAPVDSVKGEMVVDIRAFLKGEGFFEAGDFTQSYAHYAEAIVSSKSRRIQDFAFERLLKAKLMSYKQPVTRRQFSSVEFEELYKLGIEKYLKSRGVKDSNSFEQELYAKFNYLSFQVDANQLEAKQANDDLLRQGQLNNPTTLQSLYRLSLKICEVKSNTDEIGFKFELKPMRARLFQAHLLSCRDSTDEAIKAYEQIATAESSTAEANAIKFFAYLQLTKLYKAQSRRVDVAKAYAKLVGIPIDEKKLAGEMELSLEEMKLFWVDQLLWAGRNKALIGDYGEAAAFCRRAIKKLDNMALSDRVRSTKAEAYQTLATRIAIENNDVNGAIAYLTLAMNIDKLNKDWRDRLKWLYGMYNYVDHSYKVAIKSWTELLAGAQDDSDKARLHFWLTRAYKELGDAPSSDTHAQTLLSKYPLSYYTVVALPIINKQAQPVWQEAFTMLQGRELNLVEQARFDLTELRYNDDLARVLLRAEIAIAADFPKDVVQLLVRDLAQELPKYRKKTDADVFRRAQIYLTRLMFAAGLYGQSFALTQNLVDSQKDFWLEWADQIYILYPRPYQDAVAHHSAGVKLDEEIIYAISRQESSFNAGVESPAGAIGLMQLIPPTARRFAKKIGTDFEPISQRLKEPSVNIKLGSAYLNFLSKYYKGEYLAVYGAYNAGEYAVDSWVNRRKHVDPLVWVEMIPFGETCTYVKNVWKNREIYRFVKDMKARWAMDFEFDIFEKPRKGVKKL